MEGYLGEITEIGIWVLIILVNCEWVLMVTHFMLILVDYYVR